MEHVYIPRNRRTKKKSTEKPEKQDTSKNGAFVDAEEAFSDKRNTDLHNGWTEQALSEEKVSPEKMKDEKNL